MNDKRRAIRPTSPAAFALLLGVLGFVVGGVIGALVGVAAGVAGPQRARVMFLAAGLALLLTAALTLLEGSLTVDAIYGFPRERPAANLFGAMAAVLLLAGLVGTMASRSKAPPSRVDAAVPEPARGVPESTIAALAASTLLGTLMLWLLGDNRWEGVAPWLAIGVVLLSCGFVLAPRLRSTPAGDRPGA